MLKIIFDFASEFLCSKLKQLSHCSTTKADFIRAKHQTLAFVFRPSKDEISSDDADLSQQLHSSVRTNNLETSLRLLSQGADANFFHPVRCFFQFFSVKYKWSKIDAPVFKRAICFFQEKGTTPLHVAAQAGQVLQVELLLVYGANPNEEDQQGRTPAYYARYVNPLTTVFSC